MGETKVRRLLQKTGSSREMPSGATPYCSDLSSGGVVTLLHSIILDVQIKGLFSDAVSILYVQEGILFFFQIFIFNILNLFIFILYGGNLE